MSKLLTLGLALALAQGLLAEETPTKTPLFAGRPIEHWIGELRQKDALVREEAIEVLADAGPAARAALPALENLLDDPNTSIRARAALALWKIDTRTAKRAVEVLVENLASASLSARLQTLNTLGEMGTDAGGATEVVLELLEDPDPSVRSLVSETLRKLGPTALPALAKALSHKDVGRRQQAASLVRNMSYQAREIRPALRAALKDEDLTVRVDVARTLWVLGDTDEPVVKALTEGVARGDPALQVHVLALAINTTRSSDREQARKVLPVIEAGLKAKDPGRRVLAAQALYLLTRDKAKVLPVYLEALDSPSSGVWVPAVRALGDLGPEAKPALPRLVELLKKNTSYSFDLGATLGKIGKPAVAPVARALRDDPKDFRLQNAARQVLQAVGPPALPEVVPLLGHPEVRVRTVAAAALQGMGPAAEPAVPELTKFLEHSDRTLRRAAVNALQGIGPGASKAVPALVKLARDKKDASLRISAIRAVSEIDPGVKEAGQLGEELLKDPSSATRVIGLEVLAKHNPEHPDLLAKTRELLKPPGQRQGVVSLLAQLGPSAAWAVPALAELLKDPSGSVRTQAVYALGQIGPAAGPAVPELLKMLQNEKTDSNLRQGGLRTLEQIGGQARDVVPVLTGLLQEKTNYENRLIANKLGTYGTEARAAGPRLVEVARAVSGNPYEQFSVLEALIRVDPERAKKEAVPLLRPQLRSPYAPDGARLLLLIDAEDKEAANAIADALKATSRVTRQRAIVAVGALGERGKTFLPDIEKALEDSVPHIRVVGAFSRWQITGETKPSVDVLLSVFGDEAMGTARGFAARQLAEMGAAAEQALPTLKEAAMREGDSGARNVARYAASRIEAALEAKKK